MVQDLATFDPAQFNFVLATRTTLALFLPLIAAQLTGWTALIWVAFGGFLTCIGDCVEDGDRDQFMRLAVGAGLGSAAFAGGVLAGVSLLPAVLGMALCAIICGLMGLWGPAYATLSLPVIWSYVDLGLPAARHGFTDAVNMAALFGTGGLFALALTVLSRLIMPLRHQRRSVALCYRRLAVFSVSGATPGPVSAETQVRGAIAAARACLQLTSAHRPRTRRTLARLSALTEAADHLFSLISAEKEAGNPLDCHHSLHAIARGISRTGAQASVPMPSAQDGIASSAALVRALRATMTLLETESDALAPVGASASLSMRAGLARLRANLTFRSVALRHALRYAAVMCVAVLVFWVFPKPFGYWVPLTVTVVLKSFAGMTLARAVQRLAGTVAGLAIGIVALPLLPFVALKMAFVALAFFLMMSVLPVNYSLAIVFLSAGLVPFEHVLDPSLSLDVAGYRLAATLIGATLALVGGHLLWPDFEHRSLPALLNQTRRAMAEYAHAILSGETAAIVPAHRTTGLEVTNLQTALQRALTEIGGDVQALQRHERASVALQRLFVLLNVVRLAELPRTPPGFAVSFAQALAEPRAGAAAACRTLLTPADGVLPALFSLCEALADLEAAPSSQDERMPPAAAHPVAKQA